MSRMVDGIAWLQLARSCPPLTLIAFLEAAVEALRSRQFIQLTR